MLKCSVILVYDNVFLICVGYMFKFDRIQSFDPKYDNLELESSQVEIMVMDDEFCDPSFCTRGQQPVQIQHREYEDTYRRSC